METDSAPARDALGGIRRMAEIIVNRLELTSDWVDRLVVVLDIAYMSSLTSEEGRPIRVRFALQGPWLARESTETFSESSVRFRRVLPLTVAHVTKLAMAADPWVTAVGVEHDGKKPVIWGLVDQVLHANRDLIGESVRRSMGSGWHIVVNGVGDISFHANTSFIARLIRGQVFSSEVDVFGDGPVRRALLRPLRDYYRDITRLPAEKDTDHFLMNRLHDEIFRTVRRILLHVRLYDHGGALLISDETAGLKVKYPIKYSRLADSIIRLSAASTDRHHAEFERFLLRRRKSAPVELLDEIGSKRTSEEFEGAGLSGAVRFVSSLTQVDGLVLLDSDLLVRGFGVEIRVDEEVKWVHVCESPTGEPPYKRIEASHFGTRHRSMMRYCFAYPGSLGFVVSQDSQIRAMMRMGDRLVLWENLRVHDYRTYSPIRPPDKKALRREHREMVAVETKVFRKRINQYAKQAEDGVSVREIRARLAEDEPGLFDALADYMAPNRRVNQVLGQMVQDGELVRITKGHYVKAPRR